MSKNNPGYPAKEINTVALKKTARFKVALVYPNTYSIGMSNLAVHCIYDLFNRDLDFVCERVFFDPKKPKLFSVENSRPLRSFDIIAFSVSYEMDFFNLLKILDNLELLKPQDERPVTPLIISGGIVNAFNHRALSKYSDLIFIGEAEENIPLFMRHLSGFSQINSLNKKKAFLGLFSGKKGFFVPNIDKPDEAAAAFVKDVDRFPVNSRIITADTEFSNTYLVEISRGCPWECKFCVTSTICGRFRPRSLGILKQQISNGLKLTDKIGLVGAAVSDYPWIDELVEFLLANKARISVSSLRVETVKPNLIKALAISGQNTITFAPEAGSDKLRSSLNKKITNEQILDKIILAKKAGIKKIKLYFMVGLPGEDESDIQAIVGLVKEAARIIPIKASIGIFVPKPLTAFAESPMESKKDILKKLKMLKSKLSELKNVDFNSSSPKQASLAYQLSKADQDDIDNLFKSSML